ncbi:MAG: AAA family ATPase [Caulobacterales bacterium]
MTPPAAILILTGPPGAGKTTIARRLAETSETPAVHLHTDDFFAAIRRGYIEPWLPASHDQNTTISHAIVAAAGAYAAGGYQVIVDGVVGPWFLDIYREAAARLGLALDYVILRADRATVVARARDREATPLADYPPNIYEGFADLGPLEPHAVETGQQAVEPLVASLRRQLAEGRFRLV